MKTRLIVSVLFLTLIATTAFAQTPTESASSPKASAEMISTLKELAGDPLVSGWCDKTNSGFTTRVNLYVTPVVQLFDVENSGVKFVYIRQTDGKSLGFFKEAADGFVEIPVAQMFKVLRAAGAPEFVKSMDPMESTSGDCMINKGNSI